MLFAAMFAVEDGPTDWVVVTGDSVEDVKKWADQIAAENGYEEVHVEPFNEEFLARQYDGVAMLSTF